MHPIRITAATAALVSLLFQDSLRAEVVGGSGNVPPVSEAPMGRVAVQRGVQAPAGFFAARLLLLVNASDGAFGKPTSLAPDLYYGITDTFQIGLLHTGPMGWQTLPGAGLCLTGEDNGCPEIYNNVGLDFMIGLLYGDFHLSLHTSLFLMPISDPTGVMWTIGLTGKFHFTDLVALFFDPQVGIMLTNRDVYEEQLFIPLELQIQVGQAISLKVLSGVTGQLSELGDTARAPLGLGLVGNVSSSVDIGLRFSFDNMFGNIPMGASRTDLRSIGLLLNIRG
jgi:hypothetical protein